MYSLLFVEIINFNGKLDKNARNISFIVILKGVFYYKSTYLTLVINKNKRKFLSWIRLSHKIRGFGQKMRIPYFTSFSSGIFNSVKQKSNRYSLPLLFSSLPLSLLKLQIYLMSFNVSRSWTWSNWMFVVSIRSRRRNYVTAENWVGDLALNT